MQQILHRAMSPHMRIQPGKKNCTCSERRPDSDRKHFERTRHLFSQIHPETVWTTPDCPDAPEHPRASDPD